MKHLLTTIIIIFAFFSLSNAEHKQDYPKVLSNPETFRNVLMNDIEYFKAYQYLRGQYCDSSYECIAVVDTFYNKDGFTLNVIDEYIDTDRIIDVIELDRDRSTHIESDGTVRHVYGNYRLYVIFRIDEYKFGAKCDDINKKDSTIINCRLYKLARSNYKLVSDKLLRRFKIKYSVILEALSEIKKLDDVDAEVKRANNEHDFLD